MGIGGPENLPMIESFANTLGAAIGATRRVVDQDGFLGNSRLELRAEQSPQTLYWSWRMESSITQSAFEDRGL